MVPPRAPSFSWPTQPRRWGSRRAEPGSACSRLRISAPKT